MVDAHEEMSCPIGSALKRLAKIHGLPPFVKLYQINEEGRRQAVVAAEDAAAEPWRRALALPPFGDSGETEGLWMGDLVKVVAL